MIQQFQQLVQFLYSQKSSLHMKVTIITSNFCLKNHLDFYSEAVFSGCLLRTQYFLLFTIQLQICTLKSLSCWWYNFIKFLNCFFIFRRITFEHKYIYIKKNDPNLSRLYLSINQPIPKLFRRFICILLKHPTKIIRIFITNLITNFF